MNNLRNDEWEKIVDTTYRVVFDMNSRGKAFHRTVAKVLNIGAKYEVNHYLCNSQFMGENCFITFEKKIKILAHFSF